MFLAWVSEAFESGEMGEEEFDDRRESLTQSRKGAKVGEKVLARQDGGEHRPRPVREPGTAEEGVGSDSSVGTRIGEITRPCRCTHPQCSDTLQWRVSFLTRPPVGTDRGLNRRRNRLSGIGVVESGSILQGLLPKSVSAPFGVAALRKLSERRIPSGNVQPPQPRPLWRRRQRPALRSRRRAIALWRRRGAQLQPEKSFGQYALKL